MQRIAFITAGVTSHLNACYKIAHQLHQRDYKVAFVSSSGAAEKQVISQGFEFYHLQEKAKVLKLLHNRPVPAAQNPLLKKLYQYTVISKTLRKLNRNAILKAEKARRKYIFESMELDQLFKQLKPDLLLIDYELHDYIIGTSRLQIPTLLLEYHCSTLKVADVPILYSKLIPTRTRWNSIRIKAEWLAVFFTRTLKSWFWRIYLNKQDWLSTLQELAQTVNFDFENRVDFLNNWHYITYRDIPILRLSAWEFDFPHTVLKKHEYVGPMVHLERQESSTDAGYQQVIQEIDAKRQAEGHRPLIFCSMGTLVSDYAYFKRVIGVFIRESNWDLILAIGNTIPVEDFDSLPTNVHLFKRVPQLDTLRRADVFLAHGGIGSINEAILLGVPMIVFSIDVMDGNGNAARVAYHKLGLRGNLKNDSSEQIAQRIEEVLSNPEYKTNAKKMQKIYFSYHQSDGAIQIIEKALRNN